jgi:choline dehydrogenase-like flavoprotein
MWNDGIAVVDAELRVRGVKSFRVLDASVVPLLPSEHPQMAVYAIAVKAADIFKSQDRD